MGLENITICKVPGKGPEDVLPLPDGKFLTGLDDGRIILIDEDFASWSELLNTGGRPLGLEICSSGKLIICCLLYTSPSPRDATLSRMPSSA